MYNEIIPIRKIEDEFDLIEYIDELTDTYDNVHVYAKSELIYFMMQELLMTYEGYNPGRIYLDYDNDDTIYCLSIDLNNNINVLPDSEIDEYNSAINNTQVIYIDDCSEEFIRNMVLKNDNDNIILTDMQ